MRPMEVLQKAAAPAFAVALGMTACSSGNQETALRVSETTVSAENGREAANACAGEYDLTANLADELFADRSSVFPALEDKEGVLLPKNEAVDAMQKQTGSDFRVAAVMSEVYNIRDNRRSPDTLTVPGFESAVDTMKKNNNSVAKRVEYICNQLSFVEPNESDFAVVGGNATEISFMRGEEGVVGIVFQTITTDRVLSGFNLGANFDDADLKAEDRKFFEQFMKDVIVTDDGRIVIRNLALNGGINVEDQKAEAPASPNPDENDNKRGQANDEGTGGNNAGGGEPHGEGDGCTGVGDGCEGNGPGDGNGPGGPGGPGEGTTTTTRPTTTTTRPTTTTTRPTTTTTSPSTTTTTNPPKDPPTPLPTAPPGY